MFDRALYYPTIDIRDEKWLKTSALYWEEISTIVPDGFGNPYNYNCRQLEDAGILKQEIVKSRTMKSATIRNKVIEYFSDYEKFYSTLQERDREGLFENRIYWEKIDPKLHDFIRGHFSRHTRDYFYSDSGFADFYMTILANHIAKRKGMNLITDTRISNRIGIGVSNETASVITPRRQQYEVDEIHRLTESILANISINHFGISPNTSINDIIEFRNKYKDYLVKYRMELQTLSNTLKNQEFETYEAFRESVESLVRNDIKVSLSDLKKALDDLRIESYIAPLSVTGIIGLASSLVFNPAITIGLTSVVISGKVVLAKRKSDATLRKNNYAYLQLMRENL